MELGIQYLVRYLAHLEHLGEHLGNLDARGADQYGATAGAHQLDFLDDGLVLLSLCAIDAVVHVCTDNRTVRRYFHDVELVDVPELACFCDSSTCHACQLVVHAEVVLQGDGGIGLCGSLHLDVLLGFDCLMQSVAPSTTFHDAARLLIHNLDFAILDDIFVVEVEHGVSLQQLLYGVDALALRGIVVEDAVFLLNLLFVSLAGRVDL